MAKRSFDLRAIAERTQSATRGMSEQDAKREQLRVKETLAHMPIARIKPRPHTETRLRDPEHVLTLAESIAALGLLEPLVVDEAGHLLAGGHRLDACRLLEERDTALRRACFDDLCAAFGCASTDEQQLRSDNLDHARWRTHHPEGRLPVRKMEFDARSAQDLALAVEAAENTQRRDYTPKQVFSLYERLIREGYTDRRGKPKAGERAAKPAIAAVIGRSLRTVERMIQRERPQTASEPGATEEITQALGQLKKAVARVKRAGVADHEGAALRKLAALASDMHPLIEQARLELASSTSTVESSPVVRSTSTAK